jgi:UDPglucose 6-dehydrogenase
MKISVVGLGKLGLCTAACFASKGYKVVGVEKNLRSVEKLQAQQCPIDETGLEELLQKSWENLTITTDIEQAVMASDVTLIIVPTPSRPDGKFTNEYIKTVLKDIGPALNKKIDFHVVDVVSTVMPGSCNKSFKPLLEDLSGKICGQDFGLVYNPEFIALGSVIRNFLNPDMVLIGASDQKSAEIIEKLYSSTCDSNPHIAKMSLINAEITKLSLNCFVTMKISFANELASICEKIPGADVDAITNAIGRDSRIGSKYLKGGLGFGGPCFPRDNLAFQAFAKDSGIEAKLAPQVTAINNEVVDRLFSAICKRTKKCGKVSILGLSYKPDTPIVEESQSIMLAQKLVDAGYTVSVHDPIALESAEESLGDSVIYQEDVYSCIKDADAVVLMTNWPQYQQLDWQNIESIIREDAVLFDCWRQLKNPKFTKLNYTGLGLGRKEKMPCLICLQQAHKNLQILLSAR